MSETNPYDHLSEKGVPDETDSLRGTTSPVNTSQDGLVPDAVVAVIDRKVKQLSLDVNHLKRVNVELLMINMHELADELSRLQTNLSIIYTPDDIHEIAHLKRYRGPNLALERIELMYSEAGRVAKEGQSSITTIKNLMNRLQEMLRKIDNDNSIDEV